MILASMALITILAAPAELPVPVTAFPTVAADQTRPPLEKVRGIVRDREGRRKMVDDCFQYYTCQPHGLPPDEQYCQYNGDPRNGCRMDFDVCNFCQICCENCFC